MTDAVYRMTIFMVPLFWINIVDSSVWSFFKKEKK